MDLVDWARTLFALIATLGLIGLIAFAARRFGMMQMASAPKKQKRMRVVESLMLDPRRRLVLVRLDAREHLLLLSASGDLSVAVQDAPAELAAPDSAGESVEESAP